MMSPSIVALFLFAVTVFVHELGHFIAGKKMGLVIERFAIGFGPKIAGWKKDGVEYVINWLPLGGYVALPQMAPMEMVEGKNEKTQEDLPEITPWAKIVVAFFGPLFSFLLALTLAFLVSWIGYPVSGNVNTTTIGYIAEDSAASNSELEIGDTILEIDGHEAMGWRGHPHAVQESIVLGTNKNVNLKVRKLNGEIKEYSIEPEEMENHENLRALGILGAEDVYIDSLIKDSPGELAGLKKGDHVIKVNGQKIYNRIQVIDIVEEGGNSAVDLLVRRNEKEMSFNIQPRVGYFLIENEDGSEIEEPTEKALIGINGWGAENSVLKPSPWTQIANSSTLIFRTLSAIASKDSSVGVQHLSGPVGIYRIIQAQLAVDWRRVLHFFVILNVNLAILNLMPIPILDGGHIVFSVVEWLRRKPLEVKLMYAMQSGFYFLLMGFFIFITYKDVVRWHRDSKTEQEVKKIEQKVKTLIFKPENNS